MAVPERQPPLYERLKEINYADFSNQTGIKQPQKKKQAAAAPGKLPGIIRNRRESMENQPRRRGYSPPREITSKPSGEKAKADSGKELLNHGF